MTSCLPLLLKPEQRINTVDERIVYRNKILWLQPTHFFYLLGVIVQLFERKLWRSRLR